MIDDILFDFTSFILEVSFDAPGGLISSYSLDGSSYDFTSSSSGGETSSIFIN